MRIISLFAALTFASGVGLAAAEPEQAVAANEEKKICRSQKVTGSLTRRTRVCMTEAQWRQQSERTQKGLDEMNRDAAGGKVCHPDPMDPFRGCPG